MSTSKDPLASLFEETLKKTVEANKIFLQEGSAFLRNISSPEKGAATVNRLRNDALTNVLGELVKLNLKHYNNLVDLSVGFLREVNHPEAGQPQPAEQPGAPGFVLEAEAIAGQTVDMQFILDNTKADTVYCELVHSDFQAEQSGLPIEFALQFKPQAFSLPPGESSTVYINLRVPESVSTGLYTSKVQVKGFEPAHFLIRITVTETIKQPNSDGGKKERQHKK